MSKYDSRPETYEHADALDVAWAAGLFEGEGWFSLSRVKNFAYPLAGLSMTDEETVKRFHDIVVVGGVLQERARGRARKPAFRWKVCNRPEFGIFAEMIGPHLGARRRGRLEEIRTESSPVRNQSGRRLVRV